MIESPDSKTRSRWHGRCVVVLVGLIAWALLLGRASSGAEAGTLLFFKSEPGESIGGGQTRTFTDANFDFVVNSQGPATGVTFFINNFSRGGSEFWSLDLAPPAGGLLVPGVYERARRFPDRQSPGARLLRRWPRIEHAFRTLRGERSRV